jgi:hypothetical protein
MTNEWIGLTDDRLADVAQQGPHALVEAMRRLRVAIEQSSAKNEIYLRRMFWLNIILGVMTFALAIAAVPTLVQAIAVIKAWFS